jgi:hypothetical protein
MESRFTLLLVMSSMGMFSCTSAGPASGEIAVENWAGVQTLGVGIGYPGTPATGGGVVYDGTPLTVGACTYTPPFSIASPIHGTGSPSTTANAGTISIRNTTSGAALAAFSYSGGSGYTPVAATPTVAWQAGDVVTVTATGNDSIGAFAQSIRTLAAPSVTFPSQSSAAQNMTLTWVPDSNAQSMSITLINSRAASVTCQVSDSVGTVTIDSSLLTSMRGDLTAASLTLSAGRETHDAVQGYASIQVRSLACAADATLTLN